MSTEDRLVFLGFEIQHIIPLEILTSDTSVGKTVRGFLKNVKFDFEDRGNKIALLVNPEVRDAIKKGPNNLLSAVTNAGFGLNTHYSKGSDPSHPGYSSFVMNVLLDFARRAENENWEIRGTKVYKRAFYDLHEFLYKINKDGYIPINGSGEQAFWSE